MFTDWDHLFERIYFEYVEFSYKKLPCDSNNVHSNCYLSSIICGTKLSFWVLEVLKMDISYQIAKGLENF